MSEPRKATELLLDLENEVKTLSGLVRAQDLNIKILSNKLNEVLTKLQRQPQPKPTVEAVAPPSTVHHVPFHQIQTVDPERQIPISAEDSLPETNSPQGFRRTSRPETFSGDDQYLGQEDVRPVLPARPTSKQTPPPGRSPHPEIIVPEKPKTVKQAKPQQPTKPGQQQVGQSVIPVMQRVVDRTGKSLFLADVEIIDAASSQPVFRGRTNGTGKWMASLGIGTYQVTITKRESASKQAITAQEEIYVDGSKSPLELQVMMIANS